MFVGPRSLVFKIREMGMQKGHPARVQYVGIYEGDDFGSSGCVALGLKDVNAGLRYPGFRD